MEVHLDEQGQPTVGVPVLLTDTMADNIIAARQRVIEATQKMMATPTIMSA